MGILILIHIFGPSSRDLKLNKWKRLLQSLIGIPLFFIPLLGFIITWFILEQITRNEWKKSGLKRIKTGIFGTHHLVINYTTGEKRKISIEEVKEIKKTYL